MNVTIGEQLEGIIDHGNVANLLEAVAHVCTEKSEHVSANWQDAHLARAWSATADKILKCAAGLRVTGVPGIGR